MLQNFPEPPGGGLTSEKTRCEMGLDMKHQGKKKSNYPIQGYSKILSIEITDLKIIKGRFSLAFNPLFSQNHDLLYLERDNHI